MEKGIVKKGWFRNLNLRLALAMAAVIIPINVLMVIISATIYNHYEEQLLNSYGNQLNIYMESIDKDLTEMQANAMDFMSGENLILLTTDNTTDPVIAMSRIRRQIENQRDWTSLPGLYYIQSHERNMIGIIKRNKSYSQKQTKQVQAYIQQKEVSGSISSELEFFSIDGACFLFRNYHFPQFSFGIMCDIEDILSDFYEDLGGIRGSLYLTAAEGTVLAQIENDSFSTASDLGSSIEKSEKKYTFDRQLGDSGCQIVWALEKSEVLAQMPVLISILWFLSLLCLAAFPLLYIVASYMIIKPLWKLTKGMQVAEKGDFQHHLTDSTGTYQMDYLYYMFNHMVDHIHLLITESYEKEIEKLKIDAVNMQLQVNQHLLLNFLNTIYSLTSAGDPQKVKVFTMLLMKYFRYVLRENSDLVTVREEIQFVSNYLEIQQIRFPDYFSSVYSVEEDAQDILIPKLLIENFVENAVKHGVNPDRSIEILINIRKASDRLFLSVCDTGNGMDKGRVEQLNRGEMIEDCVGQHIGIWNCNRRLKLYYGSDYSMKITSRPGEGTQVWLDIPVRPKAQDHTAVSTLGAALNESGADLPQSGACRWRE